MNSFSFAPVVAAALLLCSSCSHLRCGCCGGNRETTLFQCEPVKVEQGIASYYGGRWIGRKTANGERYQPEDLTAAHRSLPFNSVVRVTNLSNDNSVYVRINNRGPFVRGRIIDLSMEAARELDMVEDGIKRVKVEVLEPLAPTEEVFDFVQRQRS